jgi:hypothetical protein
MLLLFRGVGLKYLSIFASMKTLNAARFPLPCSIHTISNPEIEESGSTQREWAPSNPEAWKYQDSMNSQIKSETRKVESDWTFPFRRPLSVSMLQQVMVSDFNLSARIQCSTSPLSSREMGVVFGYQDPGHYYYVHLSSNGNQGGSRIFVVNGAEWKPLQLVASSPAAWADGVEHRVRIERNTVAGEIRVYVDNAENPVLEAHDKTYLKGLVGVGTLDGKGKVDQVELKGVSAR